MSRIRTLDISSLNDRLDELIAARDALNDANEKLGEAETELATLRANEGSTPEEIEAAERAVEDGQTDYEDAEQDFGTSEGEELGRLESLRDEIGSEGDHISEDGGPFVREEDFEDYARELADDIGAIDRNAGWPVTCIDWTQAAHELQMDYSSVEWDGDTYLYRS